MPPPLDTPRHVIVAALVVLVVVVIAAYLMTRTSSGEDFNSSFQIGSWDPAYSAPLSNPYAPRSRLFRDNSRAVGPGWSNPLQVSAASTSSPKGEGFRGARWHHRRYADPLWFAGPMTRYRWRNTPYFRNGPTPSYYGSFPYPATW